MQGLSFSGHTVASSTPAAIALLQGCRTHHHRCLLPKLWGCTAVTWAMIVRAGAAQPKAHLRVLLPFRSAPALGAHCLREGGWRVVKQLLLMSHGPHRMPAEATGTAPFLPSADG